MRADEAYQQELERRRQEDERNDLLNSDDYLIFCMKLIEDTLKEKHNEVRSESHD